MIYKHLYDDISSDKDHLDQQHQTLEYTRTVPSQKYNLVIIMKRYIGILKKEKPAEKDKLKRIYFKMISLLLPLKTPNLMLLLTLLWDMV